jgi:hypothetical protein
MQKLDRITELFRDECQSHGLTVLTLAADKHGVPVWECVWNNNLNRYLMMSASYMGDGCDTPPHYLIEFVVAADDGLHFANKVSSTSAYEAGDFEAQFATRFLPLFHDALDAADSFTESDLTQQYLVPREGRIKNPVHKD